MNPPTDWCRDELNFLQNAWRDAREEVTKMRDAADKRRTLEAEIAGLQSRNLQLEHEATEAAHSVEPLEMKRQQLAGCASNLRQPVMFSARRERTEESLPPQIAGLLAWREGSPACMCKELDLYESPCQVAALANCRLGTVGGLDGDDSAVNVLSVAGASSQVGWV